jgi:hypothetical protein
VSGYVTLEGTTQPFNASKGGTVSPIELECPAGKVPVGGGHQLMNTPAQNLNVISSGPVTSADFTGWRVVVKNMFGSGTQMQAQVRVFVTCATMAQ